MQPAEQQSEKDAHDGTYGGDETTLEEEDAGNLTVAGSEVTQSDDIVLVFITVILVGWLAVWYPVRYFSKRLLS